MVSRRQERVSELLREELSILISTELTDPRLEDTLVNVTDVRVSPDLRNARVYVQYAPPSEPLLTHALREQKSRQVIAALEHATGFLRQALVENLNLRFVPELHFQIDTTEEKARRIDELLDAIAEQWHPESVKDSQGGS